jgi:hypothetical protein
MFFVCEFWVTTVFEGEKARAPFSKTLIRHDFISVFWAGELADGFGWFGI